MSAVVKISEEKTTELLYRFYTDVLFYVNCSEDRMQTTLLIERIISTAMDLWLYSDTTWLPSEIKQREETVIQPAERFIQTIFGLETLTQLNTSFKDNLWYTEILDVLKSYARSNEAKAYFNLI